MMRMLLATDGSQHATRAAALAARLARELRGAEVVLRNSVANLTASVTITPRCV